MKNKTYKVENLEADSNISHKITAEDKNKRTYQYKAFFAHLIFVDENVYGVPSISKREIEYKSGYINKSNVKEKVKAIDFFELNKHHLLIKNGKINTFKEPEEDYRYGLAKQNHRHGIKAITNNFFNLLFKPLEEKLLKMYNEIKKNEN